MRKYLLPMVICGFALTGCMIGKNAANMQFATSPAGVTGKLQAMNKTLTAELIEVRENEMIFLDTSGRLILLPYHAIQLFQPDKLSKDYIVARGQVPSAARKLLLKAVSHFPQGMTPDIQRRMLGAYKQDDFISLQ